MERKAYEHLRSLYTESLGKLYEKDIRKLFDVAREAIGGLFKCFCIHCVHFLYQSCSPKSMFIKIALFIVLVTNGTVLPMKNQALLGLDSDQWTSEPNTVQRDNFESTLDNVLTQLEPVCLQEQQFCVSFFQVYIINLFKNA